MICVGRGLEKKGGKLLLKSHVEEILIDNGRAVGVRLRGGKTIKAKKAVVSNASSWDTQPLIPEQERKPDFTERLDAPLNRSFMHLHLGFDATGGVLFCILGGVLCPKCSAPPLKSRKFLFHERIEPKSLGARIG